MEGYIGDSAAVSHDLFSNVKVEPVIHNEIIKSESDERCYRVIQLANAAKVLLVSDSKADKAAACLSIRIDPFEMQGLAHFCEHMILLGSEKFPDENAFSKFISSNGGFSNAYTSAEETSFAFDLPPENLSSALEIFSALFVSPRFTPSAVEREVNAVNSEHEKNLSNDLRRLIQVDKALISPNHDYSKFSTGNRTTLLDVPLSKNVHVRDELIKFYSTYYSSNLITITILGKESLDEMESKFAPMFAGIQNKNIGPREWKISPWSQEFLRKKILITPVKDIHELHIFWPIPDFSGYYKSRPSGYLGHLLGHEAAGSLLSALKSVAFANELSAETYRPGSGFACFLMRITLTDNGVDHVDDIIKMTFQYIAMLKQNGIQEWIFNEERDLQALRFRFKGSENPYQYVLSLSSRLFLYPPKDVLSAPYLLTEYRPDLIEEILSCLVPDQFRCFLVSKKIANKCTQKEQYYGTMYSCETIPDETIEKWKLSGLRDDLFLPRPNPYLPYDFALKFDQHMESKESLSVPRLLREESGVRLWFKQDTEYRLPKVFVNLNIISAGWRADPVVDLLYQLFVSVFSDCINEEVYLGRLSGLFISISSAPPALRLNFSGYNHKMPLFLDRIIYELLTFRKPDENRFDCLLDELKQRVNNFTSMATYEQAEGHFYSVIYERVWSFAERQAALKEISYEMLVKFIHQFFERAFIEAFVYGNALPVEAERYGDLVLKALSECTNRHPPVTEITALSREVLLTPGNNLPSEMQDRSFSQFTKIGHSFVYTQPNPNQPTSAILVYLQCFPHNTADNAMNNLFVQITSEPAYNRLRTEQQLGYVVLLSWHRSVSMQGVRIIIQSKLHPKELDEHIEEYLADVERLLQTMSPNEFKTHCNSVIASLLEKPKKMSQQCLRYWFPILLQHYDFDQSTREAAYLETVTKSQMIDFYRTYIQASAINRKKLAVHVVADSADTSFSGVSPNAIVIENAAQFKRTNPLSGLRKSNYDFTRKDFLS